MRIREYTKNDCIEMYQLFYDTVHAVNAKDYTESQLSAWATGDFNFTAWNSMFLSHYTVIACENHRIVGFGDIDDTGYINMLFVHKDYQRQGIAHAILQKLEEYAYSKGLSQLSTHASITAKPFFENHKYYIITENIVERKGIKLLNYVMKKSL